MGASAHGRPHDSGDPALGRALARLRRRAGLTGHQLGELVGMSQAKVSRMETGTVGADPGDVELMARALGADDGEVRRLVDLATRLQDREEQGPPTRLDLVGSQDAVGELERTTRTFRIFQPTIVVGLLQTSEYARSVLRMFHDVAEGVAGGRPDAAVPQAVSARVRRQVILADADKEFHIVMSETVLSYRLCPPVDMLAQMRRLRDVSRQGNVTLKFFPVGTQWTVPPFHGFQLMDDRSVVVDLMNTTFTSHVREDTALYRRVFDTMEDQGTDAVDEMLDRYEDLYTSMLQRSH